MIYLLICGIAYWIFTGVQDRSFSKTHDLARKVVARTNYEQIFDDHFLGLYGFEDVTPSSDRDLAIIEQYDRGVESRLSLAMARRLPKWVIHTVAKEVGANSSPAANNKSQSSAAQYVSDFINEFASMRAREIQTLLNAPPKPTEDVPKRRRRRR